MMSSPAPAMRRDLDFIPAQLGGQTMILIRDHLGLVQEGKALAPQLYQLLILLDGSRSVRELQIELMRRRGGVLVSVDEINRVLNRLDVSYLLESERFQQARKQIEDEFAAQTVRTCVQCGRAYPREPDQLKAWLDRILAARSVEWQAEGEVRALVAPHIDPSAGAALYALAYHVLKFVTPQRVVLLGTGHQLTSSVFCVSGKDFETPLGIVKNDSDTVRLLRKVGGDALAPDDFAHRSEHSLEFQLVFLQHLFASGSFAIVPILCGSLQGTLPVYQRDAFLQKAGPFLTILKQIVLEPAVRTLIVVGVDFSHIGPKFGHDRPAEYMESQTTRHDDLLLQHLARVDSQQFWEESMRVGDQFHVCGFSSMACLLEILPECRGHVLGYQLRHERTTQSAVSFAAVAFTT